jgi:uncharacterized membrane protein YdfJ with MMPL/SSD domain
MENIKLFIRSYAAVIILTAFIVFMLFLAFNLDALVKNEPLVLYKQNPELSKINEDLKNQVFEREAKILVLETKIETLEKTKKQQSWNLANSTNNLETEVIEVVKIVQDSTLIILLDRVKLEQKSLVKTYENIIELKDSVIFETDKMVQSYVIATDKMSNEIESLHAKNNELLINESRNKGKIKKRNRIIIIGGSIVAAGIGGLILLSK